MSWKFAALVAITVSSGVAHAFDVPFLSGRVVDEAAILDDAQEAALSSRLENLERETGAQVVVLTVGTLDGLSVEDASIQVAETWKLGRAEHDDGILLLVAPVERKLRIEVGYGLEGTIPDARARRIIDHAIVPAFKSGDFGGGIEAGVDQIDRAIRGEADTLPLTDDTDRSDPIGNGCFFLFFLAFMAPFVWAAIATKGFSGWFLTVFLTPFFAVFMGLALPVGISVGAIVIGWLVFATIARLLLPERFRVAAAKGGRSSWSGGSSSGGGWSSGGGGGFSGGGGSFGGGGASGGW